MKQQLVKQQNLLQQTLQAILDEAKKLGASAAEVSASLGEGFTTNVRKSEVDTLEYLRDKNVAIAVYFDQAKGVASTTDISESAWQETLAAACRIAKYTQADPCHGLADKARLATNYPDLDLYHPWNIEPTQAIELAKACEAYALNYDKRINNSEGASISTYENFYAYANSHGFIGYVPTTRHSISCTVVAQANQDMQRDYYYSTSRLANQLENGEEIATIAAQKTLARLQPRRVKTCEVPVLFSNELSRGLLGTFVAAISGGNIYRKSSFLCDKLEQQIFAKDFSIYEEPLLKQALGSSPFDGEGVATQKQFFLQQGILKQYVLGSYSARKLGMQTTGNAGGIHNLQITSTQESLSELFKKMHNGLYVTELMGQGIRLITGDYSRGAAGFWIENGEIAYPVAEITIAGNLADMYKNILAVGGDIDKRGSIQTGPILIEKMTVAGE
ncbi:MAG: metalloprotease PmbA [Pseudomonadota bacterium]